MKSLAHLNREMGTVCWPAHYNSDLITFVRGETICGKTLQVSLSPNKSSSKKSFQAALYVALYQYSKGL